MALGIPGVDPCRATAFWAAYDGRARKASSALPVNSQPAHSSPCATRCRWPLQYHNAEPRESSYVGFTGVIALNHPLFAGTKPKRKGEGGEEPTNRRAELLNELRDIKRLESPMGSQRKTKSGAFVHPAPEKRFPGLRGLSVPHTPGPECVSPGGRSPRDPGATRTGKQKTRVSQKLSCQWN